MEWYKKALLGASLLGLSSLAGYGGESVKSENDLALSNDGTLVIGKLKEVHVSYRLIRSSDKSVILMLGRSDTVITIHDGYNHTIDEKKTINAIDGDINYFGLSGPNFSSKYLFCKDDGTSYRTSGLTKEEAEKVRKWSNERLKKIYEICKEKFGDKLKIPYEEVKEPEKSLDDILKDFDF